jgi:tetratricopeptide (TPR) repeat protein
LIIIIISIRPLYSQSDFNSLKADIINAESERSRLEALITLGVNYGRNQIDSITYYADSLASSDFTDKEFALLGKAFVNAVATYHKGDLKGAIPQLELVAGRFDQMGSTKLHLRALNYLGISYQRTREFQQAIEVFDKIIELCGDNPEFISAKVGAYGNQSTAYRSLGSYAEAINNLEQLLSITENPRFDQSMTYLSMGQMLNRLQLYNRAQDAFSNFDLENFPSDSPKIALFRAIAESFKGLDKLDSAYANYNKAYALAQKTGNWRQELNPQIEMVDILILTKELDSAYSMINSAQTFSNTRRFTPPAIADLLKTKLEVELALNNLEAAQETAIQFEDHMNRFNIASMGKAGYGLVAQMHEKLGNTQEALKYEKISNEIVYLVKEANSLLDQRNKLAMLDKDKAIKDETAQTSFYKRIGLNAILIAAALLTILVYLFLNYRKTKKEKNTQQFELDRLKEESIENNSSNLDKEYITLKSKALLKLDDIQYIASDGPYLEVYLNNKSKPEVDRNTLKNILKELPQNSFLQIHRSYIVNISKVKSLYSNKLILNDETELSVSRSFKDHVESILHKTDQSIS